MARNPAPSRDTPKAKRPTESGWALCLGAGLTARTQTLLRCCAGVCGVGRDREGDLRRPGGGTPIFPFPAPPSPFIVSPAATAARRRPEGAGNTPGQLTTTNLPRKSIVADDNHRPGVASPTIKLPKWERHVTVSYTFRSYDKSGPGAYKQAGDYKVPWIRLSGRWLEAAGFSIQARVRIRIMAGCLVLTTD
ncbi:SymE family type I addiction module toxin [Aquabacterium sp. A7-Y]|uniref:SymE family type I addiction module toxin n=1 Tax=Aquabacterium sp. A7-Y TaxID=1349605 RepID=UPI0039FCBDDE